ncbi:MAG: YceI family protein [Actinomycetota bacterium]|nr:YceI family protein [Actinomycetota bacterium]
MSQVATGTTTLPPAGKYELDTTHTTVEFVARHMISKVRGRFTELAGSVVVGDTPEASSAEVEVVAGSVTTHLEQRDNHLKSGDFLDLENHPTFSFRSTAVRVTGKDSFEIDGDLTIKDITNPVTLKGEFLGWGPDMEGKPMFAASAKATIDREDWDMTWNMAVETGGFLVSKKVDIEIEVEAHKAG